MGKNKYYITESGEVVSTARYLGEYEDMFAAKAAAFDDMGNGDILLEYPAGADPMEEDQWGCECVDASKATATVILRRTDDSIEGVPSGKWFWDGKGEDYETFYNANGTVWSGDEEDNENEEDDYDDWE